MPVVRYIGIGWMVACGLLLIYFAIRAVSGLCKIVDQLNEGARPEQQFSYYGLSLVKAYRAHCQLHADDSALRDAVKRSLKFAVLSWPILWIGLIPALAF